MENPEGLANNPFITIPFGIIIGIVLDNIYKYLKNKKRTKQILITVCYEIKDNLLNPIETIKTNNASTKRWKVLNTVSGNIFRSEIGNLTISPEQIQSILKIYKYFDSINDEIVDIRRNTKDPQVEIMCDKAIKNYYSDCIEEINRYQEKWKLDISLEDIEFMKYEILKRPLKGGLSLFQGK